MFPDTTTYLNHSTFFDRRPLSGVNCKRRRVPVSVSVSVSIFLLKQIFLPVIVSKFFLLSPLLICLSLLSLWYLQTPFVCAFVLLSRDLTMNISVYMNTRIC